nr:DUF4179 domain-containing protein [uncultured Agathobaculum sp.]
MINHNDFPKMTGEFDRCVRQTLDSLPKQPPHARRFPLRRTISAALAAATVCIGGTAFAASDLPQAIGRHFTLLLNGTDEQLLNNYTVTPEPGAATDENDKYRMTVESVLYDESAGVGLVSLHLQNKTGDGVMPFETSEVMAKYQNPDIVWGQLSECVNVKDGQYIFSVVYDGDFGFCGGRFYLDESRSTDNDYYIEGAFIPSGDYTLGTPLHLVAQEQGKWQTWGDGSSSTALIVLDVPLPEFERMPYYQTADGAITLSQIGLRISAQQADEVLIDRIERIAVKMKDGTEQIVLDNASETYQTLYAMGFGADSGYDADTAAYVLAQTFDLADVQAVVLNGTEYPLSA